MAHAPSNPFFPTIQTTTSLYLPHATVALDLLPPYHGYSFQEKDLENGIIRPHDVLSGEALRDAWDKAEKEARRKMDEKQSKNVTAEGGLGGLQKKRLPRYEGFGLLCCEESQNTFTIPEAKDEIAESSKGATALSATVTGEKGAVSIVGDKHSELSGGVWKAPTVIPRATALLGSLALLRPTLPEQKEGLEYYRRQRRYPDPSFVDSSPKNVTDPAAPLSCLELTEHQSEIIEKALMLLESPKSFKKRFEEEALKKQTEKGLKKDSKATAVLPPLPPVLSVPVCRPDSGKNRHFGAPKKKRCHRHLSVKDDRLVLKHSADQGKVEESEAGEDINPNEAAVKACFRSWKAEASEEKEKENQGGMVKEEDGPKPVTWIRNPLRSRSTSSSSTTCSSYCTPRSQISENVDEVVSLSSHYTPTHLSPSAARMFRLPAKSEVPRGSAAPREELACASLPRDEKEAYELVEPRLRWLLYQEQYERVLLETEERESNPIPYYGSFTAKPGDAFLQERLNRSVPLRNIEDLHYQVGSTAEKVVQDLLSGNGDLAMSQSRKGPEVATQEATLLERSLNTALKEKQSIFENFVSLFDCFKQRLLLVKEEKKARLALLSQFISCKYPEPCRCLLWDMEILEESGVELEPAVHPSCMLVSAVLSLSHAIHEQLLAEREKELGFMRLEFECLCSATFSYEHFLLDEARQWKKLVLYNQYSLQLASRHHRSASAWCQERGLPSLEGVPEEEEQEEDASSDSSEGGHSCTAADLNPQEDESSVGPKIATPAPLLSQNCHDLKQLRQSRLHAIGPNDSPFCSYLKFLEVIITTVLESDGRQTIEQAEAARAACIASKMADSFTLASFYTQLRGARETEELEELFERENLLRERIEYEGLSFERELLALESRARCELLASEIEGVIRDGLEGARIIIETHWNECVVDIRAAYAARLQLQRAKLTKQEELALVKQWGVEAPIQYIQCEQSRLRMTILNEEEAGFTHLYDGFEYIRVNYLQPRDEIVYRLEANEREMIRLQMEEDLLRLMMEAEWSRQQGVLVERVMIGEEDVLATAEYSKNHQQEAELNLHRHIVAELGQFAHLDEVADIFH